MPDHQPRACETCRICKSSALDRLFVAREQELWRCRGCGFVQVACEPSSETLDAIYSESYFTSSKYRGDPVALDRENERRLCLLKRWAPLGAEVLDAGCSTGDFVSYAKSSFLMHGNDYSEFAIRSAQERNPDLADRLKAGRLEDSVWANKVFDAIRLWDVIEHIWEPLPVIADLLRRVKPEGVILMSTPAADSLMARLLGPYWPFMTPPEHLSFLSLRAFEAAAQATGGCSIVGSSRRGKWANRAFIGYKVTRIAPKWFLPFSESSSIRSAPSGAARRFLTSRKLARSPGASGSRAGALK